MENKFFDRVKSNLNELSEEMNVFPELRENITIVDEFTSNISKPMLIMVMGEFSTGKSTFINALLKRKIATVGAGPTTAVITKLSYGAQDKVEVVFRDGTKKTVSPSEFSKLTSAVSEHEYDDLHATIDYVSRTLPIDILKDMTIVDSPGFNDITDPLYAETTRKFMDKSDIVVLILDICQPLTRREINVLKKLNPRLSPVVVLNKIDYVREDGHVESIIAYCERELHNNKIQVQKIIGLSAKWAFEGARKHDIKLITASNIGEFYNVVNNAKKGALTTENKFFDRVKSNLNELSEKMNVFPELRKNVTIVDEIIANISRPVMIMVMGEFSTGKSTFINALVKRDIATVGARPTTAVITKLSYGAQDQIEVVFRDGTKKTVKPNEFSKLTSEVSKHEYDDLHATIDYVSRTLPIDILKDMTIVDSPGLNSIKPVHAETTRKFMDKADTVIWLFSADTPAKQTEIDALKKLNPRLSPVVILNKIDAVDEEEDESVESIIADIGRKLRNNKIYAQKFIGLSAKWAFEGARKNNTKLITASNIGEFYNVINNVIVPNRDKYKQNSLFDEIGYLVSELSVTIKNIHEKNAFLHEENFSEYEKATRNLEDLKKHLKSFFKIFVEHVRKNTNPSEEFLLGIFYFGQIVPSGNKEKNYSYALNHLRKAADLGHHYAMTLTGLAYYGGFGVQQDYSEALAWFQKAAECDNAEALNCIGNLYYDGNGVRQDYKKAAEFYAKAADLGNSMAAAKIGDMYNAGKGVKQDYSEALAWFQKAADGGNAEALSCIGTLYYKGNGVKQDYTKATEFYTKAVDLGDPMAANNLAYMYSEGLGVGKDLSKACVLFEKAAESGVPEAMMALGVMYRDGLGVKKDAQEAAKWTLKAAETGNAGAMRALGVLRYYNDERCYENYHEAFKWFKKAANAGDIESFWWLGLMYHEGEGIRQDFSEAFKWFKKGTDAGDGASFYWLGLMYHEGQGIKQDYFEAFKWLKKAADTGDGASFYWLGLMYHEGQGVKQNFSEALTWFRKAADNGDEYATVFIARMYRYGEGVTQNYDIALSYYHKAINAGNDIARTEKAELEREIEAERERERQRALVESSSSTSNANNCEDNSDTAMLVGAGIGLAFGGPLGAVVGGWLGKRIFGK